MHVLSIARRPSPIESATAVDSAKSTVATHVLGVIGSKDYLRGGGTRLDAVETECFGR